MVVLDEIIEGSSSSSSRTHEYRYDVFLSFRGADTRNNFTDHLYNALVDSGMTTFLDDEEIETGEELKPELESAIKASRASIIVLSKNYAFSTWCLEELVLILEQHTNSNQIVIPIFYHVEPTDVRKQQYSFGDAMAKHKQRMEEETNAEKRSQLGQKMELWKKALTQVADLKGKDVSNRVVYDDGKMEEEGEGDVLGYYKSWNHIIGGDLSSFQTTTGEYLLNFNKFLLGGHKIVSEFFRFIDRNAIYKDYGMMAFKAFSPRK